MYTTTKYTKEAMFPHTGTWTLNEFVLAAGDATSDNLPPRFAQIQYSWRSPTLAIQEQIWRVLANNARHAAASTGCRAYVRWVTKTRVGLPNNALADLDLAQHASWSARPLTPRRRCEFGRGDPARTSASSRWTTRSSPSVTQLTPPQEHEARLRAAPARLAEASQRRRLRRIQLARADRALFTARPRCARRPRGYAYPDLGLQRAGRPAGGGRSRHVRRRRRRSRCTCSTC